MAVALRCRLHGSRVGLKLRSYQISSGLRSTDGGYTDFLLPISRRKFAISLIRRAKPNSVQRVTNRLFASHYGQIIAFTSIFA